MRVAVISDVHGNVLALESVLDDIARQRVDATINLGDHLSGPLWPAETARLLMSLDLPSIRGNHDRRLVEREPEKLKSSDAHARAHIGAPELDWLRAMPATLVFGDLLMAHGTPASDKTYWLEVAHKSGHMLSRPLAEIEAEAEGHPQPVLLCGHSHLARLVQLGDGRLVVNPGSVGCPAWRDDSPFDHAMSTGSPHARYAVLERRSGRWTAAFHAVPYAHERASALARENGRLDWAEGLATGWLR